MSYRIRVLRGKVVEGGDVVSPGLYKIPGDLSKSTAIELLKMKNVAKREALEEELQEDPVKKILKKKNNWRKK